MTNSAGLPTSVLVAPAAAAAASVGHAAPGVAHPDADSACSYARLAPNWMAVMGAKEVALI